MAQTSEAIIGFCFGTRQVSGPDEANAQLAELCDEEVDCFNIPLLAQLEIGTRAKRCDLLLPQGRGRRLRKEEVDFIAKWRNAHRNVDITGRPHLWEGDNTHETALAAMVWCEPRGIRHVTCVAGCYHLPRATAALEKVGFVVVRERSSSRVFDPLSEHAHTRSPLRNLPMEFVAYLLFRRWGYI